MAAPLSRGTRIDRPRADGSLVPGTILGPAFGEGFYRAELRGKTGPKIVCLTSARSWSSQSSRIYTRRQSRCGRSMSAPRQPCGHAVRP